MVVQRSFLFNSLKMVQTKFVLRYERKIKYAKKELV